MHLPISLFLVSYAFGTIIHENAICHKVNEITTTRSRWLITFVQGLSSFRHFLALVSADIKDVANVTHWIISLYDGPKQDNVLNTLLNLHEVDSLEKILDGILCGASVVVPYCYLFLMSVFILWFSYYVSDIFCKF